MLGGHMLLVATVLDIADIETLPSSKEVGSTYTETNVNISTEAA